MLRHIISRTLLKTVAAVIVISLLAAPCFATDSIGFNFYRKGLTAMGLEEVAGIPGFEQANWNSSYGNSNGDTGNVSDLIDDEGVATTASLSWSSQMTWRVHENTVVGDALMMQAFLDTSDTSTTEVTVSDIPYESYSLVIYMDGGNDSCYRNGKYTVVNAADDSVLAGPVYNHDPSGVHFDGTYIQTPLTSTVDLGESTPAGNYFFITGLNASSIRIEATGASTGDTHPRAPVNGIQIIAGSKAPIYIAPTNGATLVELDQDLSWDAPDDPNIAQTLSYSVYMDPNETKAGTSVDTLFKSEDQAAMTFDPGTLDYDTTYYWRVEAKNQLNDANQTVANYAGAVWSFTTKPDYLPPVLSADSVITTLDLLPLTVSATVSNNSRPITSASVVLLEDDMDYPGNETTLLTDDTADFAAPTATLTTDVAGTYKILFTVSDDDGIAGTEDTTISTMIEVVVYEDACQAQKDVLGDSFQANYYDKDENCVVDILDFADFAEAWLNNISLDASYVYQADVVSLTAELFDSRIESESADPNAVAQPPLTDETGIRIAGGVLAYASNGTYVEYEVDLSAGTYDVYYNSASPSGGTINFGDGVTANAFGSIIIPATGDWGVFQTSYHQGALTLDTAGVQTLRITFTGGVNSDWFILDLQD